MLFMEKISQNNLIMKDIMTVIYWAFLNRKYFKIFKYFYSNGMTFSSAVELTIYYKKTIKK